MYRPPTSHRLAHRERALWVVVLTVTLLLASLAPARAYIDPGTTTMIFSAVVAFFAAAGMTVRITWRRILRFFGRAPEPEATADDLPETEREHQPERS